MRRVNFLWNNKSYFEHKFKRNPKVWTIEEVHDLWKRACARSNSRWKIISDYTKEIVKHIPKNDRGEYVVYFKHDKSPKLMQYKFSYNRDWKSYGVSTDTVSFSNREEKLEFFTANELAFEMGQKYYELKKLSSDMNYKVRHFMWELIEAKLQKHFKDLDVMPPEIFIIDIADKKYYVELDTQHRYRGYMRFHFKGECVEGSLKLEGDISISR